MDELTLVRDLRPDPPLPDRAALAPTRRRVMSGVSDNARRPRARRVLLAGWATAVAAGLTAILVFVPGLFGGHVPPASAATVLHRAAEAARLAPEFSPEPDQFLYLESGDGFESWFSIDGTRDGLRQGPSVHDLFYGCVDGHRPMVRGDQIIGTEECQPEPAYLPDLPTDSAGMLQYFEREFGGTDANAIGKGIRYLIEAHYLPPAVRAALFDAAATVPGLTVVEDVTDGAGRPGIGIAWSTDGRSGLVVFDPQSFVYLGFRQGTYASAQVRMSIVDEIGQRP